MQKKFYIILFLTFSISFSCAEETFLSLKKSKVNVRYGPSFNSDIKYSSFSKDTNLSYSLGMTSCNNMISGLIDCIFLLILEISGPIKKMIQELVQSFRIIGMNSLPWRLDLVLG